MNNSTSVEGPVTLGLGRSFWPKRSSNSLDGQPGLWCRQPPRLARRGYGQQLAGGVKRVEKSARVASMGPRHSNGDHAG